MQLSNIGNASKIVYSSMYVITDSETNEVVLSFDTIEEVSFKASSNVTSYPTELGINVTDYKYDNPDEIEVTGIINKNSYIGKSAGGSILGKAETVEKIRTELEFYKSGIYKLDVQTKAGLRQGYTLTGYEIPENIDNYSQFYVTMSFTQIKTINTYNPKSTSDSDTINLGSVEVKEK